MWLINVFRAFYSQKLSLHNAFQNVYLFLKCRLLSNCCVLPKVRDKQFYINTSSEKHTVDCLCEKLRLS